VFYSSDLEIDVNKYIKIIYLSSSSLHSMLGLAVRAFMAARFISLPTNEAK